MNQKQEKSTVAQFISAAPFDIFYQAQLEARKIDWSSLPADMRSEKKTFQTSTALHLRVHKTQPNLQYSLEELCEIIDCVDTPKRNDYPAINQLIQWAQNETKTLNLARIMLVKLAPKGVIPLHIDPGKYFQTYFRFHIPIFTNDQIIFHNEYNEEHLPEGHLYQLFNQFPHGVKNLSDKERVHLIFDAN